ncbi:MAG: ABC transporter permease [Bryobacteraceae bacterium]
MTWWQRLFHRKSMEEQLDKELRFHLERHAADLTARGFDPDEARRQARLAFGGPEQVKESCRDARGTRWLEDLVHDLRYALRTMRQKPGFAAVAVLTLALGTGATTVMFTVVNGVLLKPLAYPEPDRLVSLHEHDEKHGDFFFSYPNFLDLKRESHSLTIAAWNYDGGGTVAKPGEPAYVSGRQISPELFAVLGVSLLRGRTFLPNEDHPNAAPVVIISYGLWQRRYNRSPAAIGMPLVLDGKSYTVVGIAPANFRLAGQEVDLFTPLGQNTQPKMTERAAYFLPVVARLRPGVTLAQATAELGLIGRHLAGQYPKTNAGRSFVTNPLREELVSNVQSTLWVLLGAVSLVLLIACVNIASLLLAHAVSRERELAVRAALGAARSRLMRQCLTESAVLALFGGALGVLLAALGIRPFILFWPENLPRAEEIHLDWRVLAFALAVALFCGILFGLAPALRVPVRDLEQAIRSRARTVVGSSRGMQRGYVISEIALAVVLLVSAGMLGQTLLRLLALDPGVNAKNVLVTRVAFSPGLENPAQLRSAWQDLIDRARRVPGVKFVALSDLVPMRVGSDEVGYWATPAAPPLNETPLALLSFVTPDYSKVMGLQLLQGRFFDEHDRLGSEPVVVIDDVLAQHSFHGQDPVGKPLQIQGLGPARVIGVVRHVRFWGIAGDDRAVVRAQMYYAFGQIPDSFVGVFSNIMSLTVRTAIPPLNLAEPLERAARGGAGDQILYEVRTMEELASDSLARQRFLLLLFGIFAGLALTLACIGIYGVLAYLTNQRVPEIGVRMALGANPGDVMRMVFRQSLGMILIGAAVGIAVSLAAGRLLERSVAGALPAGALTYATMISVLAAAALAASFLPARRASRIDPMSALRQE